jgi:ATP-dependent Lon protease
MRDFHNAKDMAKTLREGLAERSHEISHSESLELIARILGSKNWQTLAAAIEATNPTDAGGEDRSSPQVGPRASTIETQGSPESQPDKLAALRRVLRTPVAAEARQMFKMPLVPMRDIVVLPGMTLPLFVGRPKSIRAIERALAGDKRLFLVAQKRTGDDAPTASDLNGVGVIASIIQVVRLDDPPDTMKVLVQSGRRASLVEMSDGEMLEGQVETYDTSAPDEATQTLAHEALERFWRFTNLDPAAPPLAFARLRGLVGQPGILADEVGLLVATRLDQAQTLLDAADPAARLRTLIALMKQERKAA